MVYLKTKFLLILSLQFKKAGVVATEFHGGSSGLTDEEYNARFIDYCQMHPIQRIGTKSDCVNAISFLADDDKASFVTGTILPIDGGLSIKGVF